ncbi:p53-like transcription factor [Lindgomyces ingoldianus]|uniref:P53-like transcription factor n=1 Tax=Lindgomyces ingoldianus TaxID=673940 RepID=A0ACB6R8Z1_9PLEO|nr:p53-like transcription factor [Lindgomyces ingoldianus]KAF2475753.1 p53-like transcription factor [Lindgomyces ingoldianus]
MAGSAVLPCYLGMRPPAQFPPAIDASSPGAAQALLFTTAEQTRRHALHIFSCRTRSRCMAYRSGTGLSDSGSGSYSASPSSNASTSLGFTTFSPTATPIYSNSVSLANNFSSAPLSYSTYGNMSSTRRMSSLTDTSSSAMSMLPPARSPGMGNPVSPSMGASARDNYTTSTPGLLRHSHTLSPRQHSEASRYSSLPDTPRSVLPTTMPLTTSGAYGSALLGYGSQPAQHGQNETPPFNAQETYVDITCEGTAVIPSIEAKIEKGFFWSSDRVWTCYRRNYFAVNVSFTLTPWIANGRLYSMAVSLSAAVDGATGKSIELIQHTPKRDKGPQLPMKKELLAPTPPGKSHNDHTYGLNNFHTTSQIAAAPQLPLQNESDQSHQYSPTSHSSSTYQHAFERIQFKSATANNGKRRAQQQYYHLIVELWANIQNPRDSEPNWVKVATRSSHPVVVRGRSPSHYSNEGPHNAGTSRGGSGSGVGGPGHPGLGSNGPAYGTGYRNGMSGGGGATMGGSMYRGNTYSLDPSPVGSHSVSSASSLSGGTVEGLVGDQHMVDEDENKPIDSYDGYQYFPAPIYEGIPSKVDVPALPLPERTIKQEFPGPAAIASGWQVGGCGRFQGMESSRGYYPDMAAHTGY